MTKINPDNKIYSVYIVTHIASNKVYIGYTSVEPFKYWAKHCSNANSGKNTRYFYRAIKKYGKEAFIFQVLSEYKTADEAKLVESLLIYLYKSNVKTHGSDFGFNMTDGGDGALGHIWSQESRDKLSKTKMGTKASDETRKILSLAHIGLSNNWLGKKASEETKKKQSEAKLGKPSPKKGKTKYSLDLIKKIIEDTENGLSSRKAGEKYGMSRSTVRWLINNKEQWI